MKPSAVVLLLFLCVQFLASESKLRQQTAAVHDDDDDEDDWDEDDDEDDDDDEDTYRPKPEVDDDGRIYKNPRNSPSAMCPRDQKQADLLGQKCLRKCSTDEDCKSKKKKCRCDGVCGMSCIKPERECPMLTDIEHGVMTVTGRLFGDRAHYTCDPDYFTVGLSERTCRADGYWTGTTPSCKKDQNSFCSQPPKIKNARHNALVEQSTFDLDNTVEYFCNHGYVTTGASKAKCLMMNGIASWFGPDITCEPQSCGPPADIANGWHAGECYTFDCRVSFHCADGYELVGRSEKICLAEGTWMPKESPQCVQVTSVQCPKPENPVNGKAVYTSYAYNSIVSYECKYGYTVVGAATRRCGADRKWTGKTPTCQEINCGSPGVLYNGWIENIEAGTGLGASIIFRCNDHMKLEGNASSVCQIDGKWRYPLPQCLAPCVVPQIENGHITVASHDKDHINNVTVVEHGERLLVSCVQNYEFAANSTPVVCNNGTWSIVPSCSPARCKQMPRSPKNGMVIAPKTDHGMKAVFKCKDGFELVGGGPLNNSISVECRYGNWTGDIPHCVQVFCPFPGFIENGKVFLVGNMGVYDYRPYVKKVVNNKQIMYDCEKGYVLDEGPTGATCIGGSWSPKELPKCIPGQHPRLRWSRKRRSVNDTADKDVPINKKLNEVFKQIRKKLLQLAFNKGRNHEKRDPKGSNATVANSNATTASPQAKKQHSARENASRIMDDEIMIFLRMVYKKLERIDARQPKNGSNSSLHELLNAMSKNFFHVDLSKAMLNVSDFNRSPMREKNQKELQKLKKEYDRLTKFYNKSIRWKAKQNRRESKRKGLAHGEKGKRSRDKRKHRKNDYKGFYFMFCYLAKQMSMLDYVTEEFIKDMKINKFTVKNGTTFTVDDVYEFFKHITDDNLNETDETSTSTLFPSTATTAQSKFYDNNITTSTSTSMTMTTTTTTAKASASAVTIASKDVSSSSVFDNEIPAKEGAPKHRSKRIRNAADDSTNASRQKRKLLSLSAKSEMAKQFTLKELEAQQQSRSKRFLPSSELDNQIFLTNLYLNAYENEYRRNVKRSIDGANRTENLRSSSRRRKGNLDLYDIK